MPYTLDQEAEIDRSPTLQYKVIPVWRQRQTLKEPLHDIVADDYLSFRTIAL